MADMIIDELARRTGMTARNIRAHQTRGLLPAPEIRGRTAWYGEAHVQRIETIRQLQDAGLSLEQIADLVTRMPSSGAEQLLALADAATPFGPEEPVEIPPQMVAGLWEGLASEEALDRLLKLGHVWADEEGRWWIASQRIYDSAFELARLGVPFDAIIDVTEAIFRNATSISYAFLDVYGKHIAPQASAEDFEESLARVQVLAGDAVLAILGFVMRRIITAAEPGSQADGASEPAQA